MTDMLSIGASGVRAHQRALETVSNNISNAENPNYVRRDLRLGELAITTVIDPYHNYQVSFGGVDIGGVARSTDPFLEANVRLTGASLYSAETRTRWMGSVETALGDGQHGIGAKLNQLFASGEELAAAPFDNILRTQFIANIDSTVSTFNRTARDLTAVSDQIAGTANQEIATLNDGLSNLAETNKALRGASDGSVKQAALLDQRDTALAVITERMDVLVDFADRGVANISFDGQSLVDVGDFNPVGISQNPDGSFGLTSTGSVLSAPSNGSLSALVASASTNAQRRTDLDNLAGQFATDLSGWQAAGRTDAGAAGTPIIALTGGAVSLTLLSSDPAELALASVGGPENGNILGLSALRGPVGAEQTWTNIVGSQALLVAAAQSENAAAASQHQAAREARDNLSSVDLDQEAADLIRFQQAYDASARVIQVARETMQSIFAIF